MKRVQKAADERNVIKWTRHHGRRGTPLSVYRVRGPSPRTQLQGTQGCNLVPQPNVVLLLLHSPFLAGCIQMHVLLSPAVNSVLHYYTHYINFTYEL